MGVYDTIVLNCPDCLAKVRFQVKSGPGTCGEFRLTGKLGLLYPTMVAALEDETVNCPNCNGLIKFQTSATVTPYIDHGDDDSDGDQLDIL